MADIINFPDESKRLLESANKKMQNQDYLAAKKDFEQLYQQNPTYTYAKKLVRVLQYLDDYTQALALVDEHFNAFINDADGFVRYFHLLLLDTQFLTAHKLLFYEKKQDQFSALKEELTQLENAQSLLSDDLKMAKSRHLASLDKMQQPIAPKDWQELIKGISLSDFLMICQKYLKNAQNPFIPPKLVEELVKDGATEEVIIDDKKVDLSELPLPENAEVLDKTIALIEEEVQDNPQLEALIIPEVRAHFALLYPFLPDKKYAADWAQSYILEYKAMFGEDISTRQLDNYAKIQEKKKKIRQIYQKLG